jgi:ABC-type transport system involved in cytochrome c biogenesis permease component
MKDLKLVAIVNISSHKITLILVLVILFQLTSMFFGFKNSIYSTLIFILDIVSVFLLIISFNEALEMYRYVNKLTKDER